MTTTFTFRIAARTILELGAELISSDGVALYELMKNAVDADSTKVRISIDIALRQSKYRAIVERIDEMLTAFSQQSRRPSRAQQLGTVRRIQGEIAEALEKNAPDMSHDLYSELIAPARDLRALSQSLGEFYERVNCIAVADWGDGMSLQDLSEIYLTIGTRSRQRMKTDAIKHRGRAYLGDKGVGRLSTMRLGGLLSVRTSRAGERRINALDIDWDRFSHDSDDLLEDVEVKPNVGAKKEDRSECGTIVRIRRLRSDWSEDKFKSVIVDEFSRIVDPFESKKANRLLRLYYNGERHYVPEIERRLFKVAHAECSASYRYEDGRPMLRGAVNYRLRAREKTFRLEEADLRGITGGSPFGALMRLGPFKVEFWWYNRSILTAVDGIGKKRDVQALVRRWSGGLMLFRDGFRINPYGGAEDDWLELDKRAFRSRGFKLNRQQVIGRVLIDHRNNMLVEQTNREGLTDTPEKVALVGILQHILFKQFKAFVDKCDDEVRVQEVTSLVNLEEQIEFTQNKIIKEVQRVMVRVPEERVALSEVVRLVKLLNGYVEQAKKLAEEYESERGKFVYLAGIGLMVEFILHELGRATEHTLKTLEMYTSGGHVDGDADDLAAGFLTLSDQLKTIVKRINTLDPLSTSRRQRREEFDVWEVVEQIVAARADQAERHGVEFRGDCDGDGEWTVRGVKGMFIQIVENLLSNSFFWLRVQGDIEPELSPYIEFDIDSEEGTLVFSDNGTGVEPSSADEIFDAFVSHRPAKEGRGLGLYISREVAEYNNWSIDIVRRPTVRKGRYNSFVVHLPPNGGR